MEGIATSSVFPLSEWFWDLLKCPKKWKGLQLKATFFEFNKESLEMPWKVEGIKIFLEPNQQENDMLKWFIFWFFIVPWFFGSDDNEDEW